MNSPLDSVPAPSSSIQANCPIRTELLAHDKAKVNLAKQIPIDQLLKIEKIVLYLEGKGKQPNTIDSFRRHIAVLAKHANLDNPQQVELAMARLRLTIELLITKSFWL